MAGSLKDQLVSAGLATPERAKKVEREARAGKQARKKGQGKGKSRPPEPSKATEARARAQQLNDEKARRDRAQMRAIADKARAAELRAEIKQIITRHDQRVKAESDDDVAYNFVHGKRIKRIYVPPAQREQISKGNLVIVNNDGHYHLLPKQAAEKIRARDPKRIIVAHDGSEPEPGSDDEYYARFPVPDDLDW
ncbi:MAG: DUF2058 domain-containing protein [Pseudomonadota bacterium]